eukprot:539986-Rhodomonas_salina.1
MSSISHPFSSSLSSSLPPSLSPLVAVPFPGRNARHLSGPDGNKSCWQQRTLASLARDTHRRCFQVLFKSWIQVCRRPDRTPPPPP